MIGELVGAYRIVAKLGEGGMGVVYLAEHPLIGRKAAVKLLLPELSRKLDTVGRFFNEARSTTMLHHPGVVDIFDFGHHPTGSAFIVMEFLEGSTLGSALARLGRLPLPWIVELTRQVSLTLAAAHSAGIVHRDLKPDNIFLVPDVAVRCGLRTKLLDFGIAKLVGEMPLTKTRTGTFVGTPTYGSPEQCRGGHEIDHPSDVYSLGCVMHEMAAGHPPFSGTGAGDVIAAHIYLPAPHLGDDVPRWLGALVHRMLAKDPGDRPTMMEVAAELDAAGDLGTTGALALTEAGPSPWQVGAQRTRIERTPIVSPTAREAMLAASRLRPPPTIPMPMVFPSGPPTIPMPAVEPLPGPATIPMPTVAMPPELAATLPMEPVPIPLAPPAPAPSSSPAMTMPGFGARKLSPREPGSPATPAPGAAQAAEAAVAPTSAAPMPPMAIAAAPSAATQPDLPPPSPRALYTMMAVAEPFDAAAAPEPAPPAPRRRHGRGAIAPTAALLLLAAAAGLTWRAGGRKWAPLRTMTMLLSPPEQLKPPASLAASPALASPAAVPTPAPAATSAAAALPTLTPAAPAPATAPAAAPAPPLELALRSAQVDVPQALAASPAPAPETVTLTIQSQPAGASIFRDGDTVRLGKTPWTQTVPRRADGEVTFVLRLPGYHHGRVSLSAARNATCSVKMSRLPAAPRPAPAAAAASPDGDADEPTPAATPSDE